MTKKEEIKPLLESILEQDMSELKISNENNTSLFEHFPEKEQITEITEQCLMQILLARRALVEHSGYLGEQLTNGAFLNEESPVKSKWELYKLEKDSDRVAILWRHIDDDSWSVFFKGDTLEIDYLYYEN